MKGFRPLQSNYFASLFTTPPSDDRLLNRRWESDVEDDESTTPREARRLKAWLTLALQSTEIGVWEWDTVTGLFHISPRWLEALGYVGAYTAPRTLEGWLDLVHPEDRPSSDCFVSALTDGSGITRQMEIRLRRADGSYAWQRCSGMWSGDPEGDSLAIGVLVDVTAKHETLTRLLQIERLETVGQLTGGLAHDFNNLLTVVQGNVDLLSDTLGDDALNAPILEEIGTVVERGAALTRRLLSFARPADRLVTAKVDPDVLIASLLPLLGHTLGGGITVCTGLAAQGWTVDVDARQFENAVINLAINARDAMPSGGTLMLATSTASLAAGDIGSGCEEKPGAYIVVDVTDTGLGMPPEVQARIFEPFFTTKADKGTGLGIPMVARFVRQAGGHIRIESTVGSGTTMRLYLPRSVAPI
jgi:signal transduction histidine kinase